jgi:competence protein ComEC
MSRPPRGTEPSYLRHLQRGIDYFQKNPGKSLAAGLVGLWLLSGSEDDTGDEAQFVIWDVEHGDAMYIGTPEASIVVDLGVHQNGFSPINYLKNNGVDNLDWLIVSHPDRDHIRDFTTLDSQFDPWLYTRPDGAADYIGHRKENIYPNDDVYQEISGKCLEYEIKRQRYEEPPFDFDQLHGHEFYLTPDELGFAPASQLPTNKDAPSLNNLSVLNVFEYNGFKLTTMGDLETKGIEMLLEQPDVERAIRGTDVLVAPHHGRESSYSPWLFDVISPEIVAISDAGGTENSAAQKYENHATGKMAERRNGDSVNRNVVTTRNDGAIYFGVESAGNYRVTIE